jgi:hypothetical protein
MARFCGKCGSPIDQSCAFCTACGAPVAAPAQAATPFQDVPHEAANRLPEPYATQVQSYVPASQPRAKSGSALRIVLIVLVVLALGALGVIGGVFYLGHKMVTKIENKAAEAGLSTSITGKSANTFTGDPCRFLSRADVSKAIGVPIIGTRSDANSCDYRAHGTAASMTSKHLSATAGRHGADRATQEKFEKLAEGLFNTQQKNAEAANSNEPIEATVMSVSFDQGSAESQMKLDSKVMGVLGPAFSKITGIGDEAFVAGDGMMVVRKGDTLVRITYISCPCDTKQIVPLAKKLSAAF